ncbi:MAG TPA: cyclic nucleotide-binding domain-containing protein [Micromonosporaceae bacterium]|nr:cyclic nucleotide-binding domain-containing protein [Micromonosporaceae bacterium]
MTAVVEHQRAWTAVPVDGSEKSYVQGVLGAGAAVRLPSLLRTPWRKGLLHRRERHGIAVVAAPTTGLRDGDVEALLRFRFAQYLDIGFIDPHLAYSEGMSGEPASVVAANDLHLVAGVPATGEILCYAVLEQPPAAPDGTRLRTARRPLFPVEMVHGAGLYNRLPILPDLPVRKVRELGRFVKNQRPTAPRELCIRAVVELAAAVLQVVAGPLRFEVDAVVGDLEEHVAKQNLDFFHVPSVVLHGSVPYLPSASYLAPRYVRHAVHPFACLTGELACVLPRLAAVEAALNLPGKLALLALLRLQRRTAAPAPSMLRADPTPTALDQLALDQADTTMPQRASLLRQAEWLRRCEVFAPLSVAEAAMLCTLMEPVHVPAGQPLLRQGEPGDGWYLIESGQARIEYADRKDTPMPAGMLEPGQCCGHLAVLTDSDHHASVVAATDMTVLRLSRQAHDTYLAGLPDVGDRLTRHALRQWTELNRLRQQAAALTTACGCGNGCGCGAPAAGEETPS